MPVPRAALLQGTHCGAFVKQSTLEQYFFLVKIAVKGQSSSPVQYSSLIFQSSEWIHPERSIARWPRGGA